MNLSNEELKQKLHDRENELRELKSMFQLVIDTIPASIFWKDKDLKFRGANKLFLTDLGLESSESIVGKTDFDIPTKKSEAEYFRMVDHKILDYKKAEFSIVESQKTTNDKTYWLETYKVPISNEQGDIVGILGTYQDITSRILHELAIEDSNRKLRIKNKELEQFAYMASHDLQEPLNTIIGFSQLLNQFSLESMDNDAQMYIQHILTGS